MNRIVVGVDGSPAATAAAQWAACEAAMRSVELTVVHVVRAAPEVLLQAGWPGRRAIELVAVHAADHAERPEAEKLLAPRLAEYLHRYPLPQCHRAPMDR